MFKLSKWLLASLVASSTRSGKLPAPHLAFFYAVTGSTLLLGQQVPSRRPPMHACCLGSWRSAVPSAVIGQVVHVSRRNTNLETVAGTRSFTAATLAFQQPSISSAEWTVYHEKIMAACASRSGPDPTTTPQLNSSFSYRF